jgi:hypothetical protein
VARKEWGMLASVVPVKKKKLAISCTPRAAFQRPFFARVTQISADSHSIFEVGIREMTLLHISVGDV